MRKSLYFAVWLLYPTLWLATALAQTPKSPQNQNDATGTTGAMQRARLLAANAASSPGLSTKLAEPPPAMAAVETMSLTEQPERLSTEYLELVNSYAGKPTVVAHPENGNRKYGMHWDLFFKQWVFWSILQQSDRLIMEPQTRAELNGPYFKDWFYIVNHTQWYRWSDGDKSFTSNIAHPAQGSVVGYIYRQNNDRINGVEQDLHNPAYTKGLLQAFLVVTVDAFNWKIGPVSEATIGHVGLHTDPQTGTNRTGLNDYIMNEVGGIPLMMGQDWLDKHAMVPFERHHTSRWQIDTLRIFTMPCQSFANLMAFKKPWYRYGRP